MPEMVMSLPVFLPGNNRDWREVPGRATITEDGEVNIRFSSPEDAKALARMAKNGILLQMVFDYRLQREIVVEINQPSKDF